MGCNKILYNEGGFAIMSKKYLFLLLITLLLAISAVSAQDNITHEISDSSDELSADENKVLSVPEDDTPVVSNADMDKLKSTYDDTVEVKNSPETSPAVQKTISDSKCGASQTPEKVKTLSYNAGVKAPKVSVLYSHTKFFYIKVYDKATEKPLKNINVLVNFASKDHAFKTDSKGLIKFRIPAPLNVGKYPVAIKSNTVNVKFNAKSSFTVVKLKTNVKASAITVKHKQSKLFKFKVTDKYNGVPIKRVKVAIWIDGKKIMKRIDSKGFTAFNTKYFSVGTHKVHLKTYNPNCVINFKTSFKVKAVAKKSSSSSSGSGYYIGNINTYKFHYPTCSAVKRMSNSNKVYLSYSQAINGGYSSCGICHP